jgi:hypothetical protein
LGVAVSAVIVIPLIFIAASCATFCCPRISNWLALKGTCGVRRMQRVASAASDGSGWYSTVDREEYI